MCDYLQMEKYWSRTFQNHNVFPTSSQHNIFFKYVEIPGIIGVMVF